MRTRTMILIAATLATGACKRANETPSAQATSTATPPGGGASMVPEHGGAVATSGGMVTEVVTQPDGKLLAYVRGPSGPVQDANVRVTVRNADGTSKPVVVAWDAQASAYVGYVWGVEPGLKTVDVTVPGATQGAPAQTVSSQVTVAAVAHPPAARYGGSVEIIGQYAVEIVPSRTGDVAFFVMDMQGLPVPDANVDLPRVSIDFGGGGSGTASVGGSLAINANVGVGTPGIGAVPLIPPAGGATVTGNSPGAIAIAQPVGGTAGVLAGSGAQLGTAVLVPVRMGDHWIARVDPGRLATATSVGFNVDLSVGGRTFSKAGVTATPVIATLPLGIAVPVQPAAPVPAGTLAVGPAPALGVAVPVAPGTPGLGVAVPVAAGAPGLGVAVQVAPGSPGLGVAVPIAPGRPGLGVAAPIAPAPGRPGLGVAVPIAPSTPGFGVAVPVAPGRPGLGTAVPVGGAVVAAPVAPGVAVRVNGPVMPPLVPQPQGGIAPMPPSVRIGAGVAVPVPPGGGITQPAPQSGVVLQAPPGVAGVVVGRAPGSNVIVAPAHPPRPFVAPIPGPPTPPVPQGSVHFGGSVNIH